MPPSLDEIVAGLRSAYGEPERQLPANAFEFILWEKMAYLAADDRRARAFLELKHHVGTGPLQVLEAPLEQLREICATGGMHADLRAMRLHESAQIVIDEFKGDLEAALQRPFKEAKKALMRFPYVGEPGAEKILLFTGRAPVLALESNGLRVLVRIGFGREMKSYSSTYRSVREGIEPELGNDCSRLQAAHLLLRRHGQQVCKVAAPMCGQCVLRERCAGRDTLG